MTLGNEVNPEPPSVMVRLLICPPTTSAVPKAPVPPPPSILNDTNPYPDPGSRTVALFTL